MVPKHGGKEKFHYSNSAQVFVLLRPFLNMDSAIQLVVFERRPRLRIDHGVFLFAHGTLLRLQPGSCPSHPRSLRLRVQSLHIRGLRFLSTDGCWA